MLQAGTLANRGPARRQFSMLLRPGGQGVEAGHPRNVSFSPEPAGNHVWVAERNRVIRRTQGPSQWFLTYVLSQGRCQGNDWVDGKPECSLCGRTS